MGLEKTSEEKYDNFHQQVPWRRRGVLVLEDDKMEKVHTMTLSARTS